MTSSPPVWLHSPMDLWIGASWSHLAFWTDRSFQLHGHQHWDMLRKPLKQICRRSHPAQRRNVGSAEGNNGCGVQIYYFRRPRLEELRLAVSFFLGCVGVDGFEFMPKMGKPCDGYDTWTEVDATKNPYSPQLFRPKAMSFSLVLLVSIPKPSSTASTIPRIHPARHVTNWLHICGVAGCNISRFYPILITASICSAGNPFRKSSCFPS